MSLMDTVYTSPGGTNGYRENNIVTGVASAADVASPPFQYKYQETFNVTVYGTFVATVELQRSFDNTNWVPVVLPTLDTTITTPVSFSMTETEGLARYRLYVTSYTSGTVNMRISQ